MAQKLSEDLLYLIFFHALPSTLASSNSQDDVRTIAPLNFALVCRSWRTVVLSRPSLRNSVDIKCGRTKKLKPYFPRLVSNWLSKISSTPLNIHLNLMRSGFGKIDDVDDSLRLELLDLVLRQYHRWNKLKVICGAFKSDDPKQIVIRCTLSVTSVELYFTGTSVEPPRVSPVVLDLTSCTRTASISSQLRVLDVCDGVKWLLPERREGLYLPNLRDLSFSTDSIGDLGDAFAVLSACPNILSFSVTIPRKFRSASLPSSQHKIPARPVTLPHLTHFIFCPGVRPTAHHLLRSLVCPSLRSFIVNFSSVNGRENFISAQDLHNFANFLSLADSRPPLTELRLLCYMTISPTATASYYEHAAALRSLLGILDNLERLALWGVAVDNELIESLTIRTEEAGTGEGSSTLMCPSLSSATFWLSENPGIQKESVEEMIVSRWKAKKRLHEIAFFIPGFENLENESERVRACVGEGMMLRCSQAANQP